MQPMIVSKEKQPDSVSKDLPHLSGDVARQADRDDFDRDVWSIFGMPVDLATAPEAVQAIETAVRDRQPLSFVTPNVNFLVRCLRDSTARREIINADLSLIDGAPLVALGRLAGVPIRERCAGSDVFNALRLRPGFPGRRLKVFFFGGREGAAQAAAEAVNKEARGVEAVGFLNPGNGDVASMSDDETIAAVNAAGADFVLVALGAAKGQRWIDVNRGRLNAPVVAHLGAVVDFTAGTIARAPRWISRCGLEWAWRIKEEPTLWRRYWDDGVALARLLVKFGPGALLTRGEAQAPAQCRRERIGGETLLELSGDLAVAGRDLIRKEFRAASRETGDVVLDLSGANGLDASFLGLVLMLEKAVTARGAALRMTGLSARHRRILAAHAMHYPGKAVLGDEIDRDRDSFAAAV